MNEPSLAYSSCIVRVWRSSDAPLFQDRLWLAQVEWLSTGARTCFTSPAMLFAYLRATLDASITAAPPDTPSS
jgi:hypothetical protein